MTKNEERKFNDEDFSQYLCDVKVASFLDDEWDVDTEVEWFSLDGLDIDNRQ